MEVLTSLALIPQKETFVKDFVSFYRFYAYLPTYFRTHINWNSPHVAIIWNQRMSYLIFWTRPMNIYQDSVTWTFHQVSVRIRYIILRSITPCSLFAYMATQTDFRPYTAITSLQMRRLFGCHLWDWYYTPIIFFSIQLRSTGGCYILSPS